jgi:hypothetical protein
MYLLKTDARGDTVWCRSRGDRYRQFCNSAQQTTDGGYIMTGEADGDVYIVRTDSSGNMLWSRSYGSAGVDYDQGRSVQQTKDGGFAVAGQFQRHGQPVDYDAYLVRTDGNGDSVWTRTYGGKGAQYGEWVRQTADGGFIMVGTDIQSRTQGFMTPGDAKTYVVRTHPNGDTLWTRTFDDTLRSGNRSVFKTADDGLVFATLTSATDSGEVCINVTTIDADGHVARPK